MSKRYDIPNLIEIKPVCGIYSIIGPKGRRYIGQGVNVKIRLYEHLRCMKENSHGNRYLQRAWNKYGSEAFRFEILVECVRFQLTNMEMFWIKYFNTKSGVYNLMVPQDYQFRHS